MSERRTGRTGRVAIAALVALGATTVASSASAQEFLKDRRYQDGQGVSAGGVEFHPGIAAEVGYDTNYFLRSDSSAANVINTPVRDAGELRLTGSLDMRTAPAPMVDALGQPAAPTPQTFIFSAGASVTYREFIGVQEIRDQRNVTGTANVRVDINQGHPVGGDLFASYQRIVQPNALGNPDLAFNRDQVGVGGDLVFVPGSGTLDMSIGYALSAALFEQSEGVPFSNLTHTISVRDRWRFRPRTALFSETTLQFLSYLNADRSVNFLDNATPFRSRFGITGLITPSISALVAAGYGATFFQDGASGSVKQYDSVIGQAEITFYLSANPGIADPHSVSLAISSLTLGYARDYSQSYLANYYGSDKGYARVSYFFANKALISLDGAVGALEYPDVYGTVAGGGATAAPVVTSFTDVRITSTLFGEYRLTPALGLNLTLQYDQEISNTLIPQGAPVGAVGAANPVYDMAWKRFQGFVGVRYFL